jgi:hypothetical protein
MSFIVAAPLMNLAYDRMSKRRLTGDGSEMLPSFLATLYDESGKFGVSLFLIGTGASILFLGYLWQSMKRRNFVVPESENSVPRTIRHESSPDAPVEVAGAPGQMTLQTRKYLS